MRKIIVCVLVLLLTTALFTACEDRKNREEEYSSSISNEISSDEIVSDEIVSDEITSDGITSDEEDYLYKGFTPAEKQLFIQYIGEVIPFVANNEYYVEEYAFEYDDGTCEEGVNFYTYGNTQMEFDAYLLKFAGYSFDGTEVDDYGDTWYLYSGEGFYIDVSYYYVYDKENYTIDVYVYFTEQSSGNGGNEDITTPEDEAELLAFFDFGAKGSANHFDGNEVSSSKTFNSGSYSLTIQDSVKLYDGAFDDKGNSCLKVGSGSNVGSFNFTVPSNVNYVVISVAQYKDKTSKITVNGVTYSISTSSKNGDYTIIGTDTSSSKKVIITTVSGASRVMIDSISFYSSNPGSEVGGGNQGGNGEGGGNQGEDNNYSYNDFTTAEKQLFIEYFGEVIPFAPNSEYYVEEYTYDYNDGTYEKGLNFYTFGNTQAEFEAYLVKFDAYILDGTEVDSYGDTWYLYSASGYYLDVAYYEYESGIYVIDVYAYCIYEGSSGSGSGSGTTNEDLMSNAGAGLPNGTNGVYTVDFTKGKYVKDVTGLGTYLNGCPTVSINKNPAVLVIPIEFSDVTASSKGYTIDKIEKAFNGKSGETDYYSLRDYFYLSSYGQLDLDITVLDYWFRPSKTSSYYIDLSENNNQGIPVLGVNKIIDEFLSSVVNSMDLSMFDSDNNGLIDAIVLINTLNISSETDMNWAYRHWNYYTDADGYYYQYDGVSANDYMWASYQFMFEGYDDEYNVSYDHVDLINTFTYIHEFSHVLGAEDYYDYAGKNDPMGGCDMMDALCGDHSAFTKFNYGWLTTSRLITAESTVSVQLEAFAKSGDTIIIANDWNDDLGLYQEYYIVAYYTNEGLNAGENAGFFTREGIVVYHVNASLYEREVDGEIYYDVYNTNTDPSDSYGTVDNLIEFVKNPADTFTYIVGDSLSSSITNDNGAKIAYTFTVDAMENGIATLTFTKNS